MTKCGLAEELVCRVPTLPDSLCLPDQKSTGCPVRPTLSQDREPTSCVQEDEYSFTLSGSHKQTVALPGGMPESGQSRLFGDSVQSSPVPSIGRAASGSLASLYQVGRQT